MERNNIGSIDEDHVRIVVDAECLVHVEKKYIFFRNYKFLDIHFNFLSYLKKRKIKVVHVVSVSDLNFFKHILQKYYSDTGIVFKLVHCLDEEDYQVWLKIKNPTLHLAIVKRSSYHRNSKNIVEVQNQGV